jgi:hypothetical protein
MATRRAVDLTLPARGAREAADLLNNSCHDAEIKKLLFGSCERSPRFD